MGNLAHSAQNDQRYNDLVSEVRELGRASAAGKDSLPMLAHRIVRAAADNVIGTDKDKDGKDEASKQYEFYVAAESKKAVHEHTSGGVKANISKLRKLIEFGVMPIIDPVDIMNRAKVIRDQMVKDGLKPKAAYAGYVDLAREQLDNPGRELSDDEIKGVFSKDAPKEKELKDVLEKMHKDLDQLISGERKDGIKDQSDEIIQAEELLRARVAAMLKAQDDEAFEAACLKRGVATPAVEQQIAA